MKKRMLYGLVSVGAMLLTGCNETWNPGGSGEGKIMPVVDLDLQTVSSRSEKGASRGEATAITVDDLQLKLTSMSDGTVKYSGKIADFYNGAKYNVGAYTLEAVYGDKTVEGFDCPYYYGATQLTVKENETTTAAVTATLGNAMLSFTFTDAFSNYFSDYSVSVSTLVSSNEIVYSSVETRPVYVAPGTVSFTVNMVKQDGSTVVYKVPSTMVSARYHYHVQFDVNNGNVGQTELTITFDDNMEQEDITVDLSADLENIPAPTVMTDGFTSGMPLEIIAGMELENPLKVTIMARGGLASVELKTESTALNELRWPQEVDLISVPEATKATMQSLGFVELGLWKNPEQMAVIDLTTVIPHIRYIEGIENKASFSITVTDRLGQQTEEPVVLDVNIEKLVAEIISNDQLMSYESMASFEMNYNGADISNRTKVQYMNKYGIFSDLDVVDISAKSRSMTTYTVTVDGLPDDAVEGDKDVVLKVVVNNSKGEKLMESDEYQIKRFHIPFKLSVNDVDVYAYRATGIITNDEESVAEFVQRAKLMMSTDGENYSEYNYTVDGDKITVEGLRAKTSYKARLVADGMKSLPVSFVTEDDKQLPNANMENWYSELAPHWQTIGFGAEAYRWFANAEGDESFWATRNALTTSTESGPTPNYVSFSGTVSVSGVSGKAAEISTIGYGKNSTFTGNGGTCKHKAAGMLFIGEHIAQEETSETFDFGKPFQSRPESLSFKYKYAPYNNESFKAYIVVENRENGVIELGRGEILSGVSKNEFTDGHIDIKYTNTKYKATHMYVVFCSSSLDGIDQPAVKNVRGSKGALGGFADSKRVGSVLTVDDITLNY